MITHMRNLSARTFYEIHQALLGLCFRGRAVNRYTNRHTISLKASSFGCRFETSMNPFYPKATFFASFMPMEMGQQFPQI
jgi:hypothetical protein